jgi:putative transcriptional regulator
MESPNKLEIKQARTDAGLSQTEAANLIYKGLRTWQQWEKGDRRMDPAFWELFLMKIRTLD